LFPEGVNVMPNAVVKSVSVSGNRLVIKLKDGRKVNLNAGSGNVCRATERNRITVTSSPTGGDRSHCGCSWAGA